MEIRQYEVKEIRSENLRPPVNSHNSIWTALFFLSLLPTTKNKTKLKQSFRIGNKSGLKADSWKPFEEQAPLLLCHWLPPGYGAYQVPAIVGPYPCKPALPLHYAWEWNKVEQEKPGPGANLGRRGLAEPLGVAGQRVEVRRVVSRRSEWVLRKRTNDVVNRARKYLKYCSSVWFSTLCLSVCEIGRLWSEEGRHLRDL